MRHTIENEFLAVTVDTLGAELVSVVDKATGAEMLWSGDKDVWARHAPVLFPYCGRLKNGEYTLDGQTYQGGAHGFVRDMEHELLQAQDGVMRLELRSGEQTRNKFPRAFVFQTTFSLMGHTLRHSVQVTNLDEQQLRFGFGYHPAFAIPFDNAHTTEDYELRFDTPQTPVEIKTGTTSGLVTGKTKVVMENSAVIPLHDRMFDEDSICLSELTAKELSIVEKDSGRRVTVKIEGYPYTLLWSAPGNPTLHFLCIEPWHSLPDAETADGDWNHKPCAAELAPGQSWKTDLDMTFQREMKTNNK